MLPSAVRASSPCWRCSAPILQLPVSAAGSVAVHDQEVTMFNPANESQFNLSIEGVGHDFKVLQFRGREVISQPYRFELEVISERADIDLQGLLHRSAFLAFTTDGAGVHGQLHSVAQGQ